MHIAFVSFEYPPDTADGGIATYVAQAIRMLQTRGHTLEVFAASRTRTHTKQTADLCVHRIQVADRQEFVVRVAPIFAQRHAAHPFDVLESPDFNADALHILPLVRDIPLVVRLHTPRYLANALNAWPTVTAAATNESRTQTKGLPLHMPLPLGDYERARDPEYLQIQQADAIAAPSQAIRDIVCRDWHLDLTGVEVIPNVYEPAPTLLEIPLAGEITDTLNRETNNKTKFVTFIGRLEQRKGVLTLAQAIPAILRRRPDTRFQFVGRAVASPEPGLNMQEYLQRLLAPYVEAITFTGLVPLDAIPQVLEDAQVCVFPSRWENFPCVCLEAMAAGRAIVGSLGGGMAEMLGGEAGRLVTPDNADQLAEVLVTLLDDPNAQRQMGKRARARVQTLYGSEQIAPRQEAHYRLAIAHRRQAGPRRKACNDP